MWHCANDLSFIGINNPDHINGNGVYYKKKQKNGGVVANQAKYGCNGCKANP
jgi:hypothetical protein